MWSWRRPAGVVQSDALAKADEADPERLKVIEQGHQVPEIAPEPVQAPDHQQIEPDGAEHPAGGHREPLCEPLSR